MTKLQVPKEIEDRLAVLGALYMLKYGMSMQDVTDFLRQALAIYTDYINMMEEQK